VRSYAVFLRRRTSKKIVSCHHNDDNMSEKNDLPPNEWETPLLDTRNKTNKQRKCGYCNEFGHNKRTCPLFLNRGTFHSLIFSLLTSTTQYSKTATTLHTVLFADHSIINQTTTNESLDSVHRNIFDTNGTQSRASVTKADEDSSTESDDDDEVQDRLYLLTTLYVVFDIETSGFLSLQTI
jgi:hypothetical protein